MRGHYIIILCVFALLLAFPVMAYDVQSVSITDVLYDSGDLTEHMDLVLSNNTQQDIVMRLPAGATDVLVNGKKTGLVNDSLTIPTQCATCHITLQYGLSDVARKIGVDLYDFTRTMDLPKSPETFLYAVKLPAGKTLQMNDAMTLVPIGAHITTDGESIIVTWEERSPELPKIYHITYEGHERNDNLGIEVLSEFGEWYVVVMLIIALVIGLAGGWYIRGNPRDPSTLPIDTQDILPASLFNPDEQTVIKCLSSHGGNIRQKELGKELGWSKSKVSAIMTNLEYKKVVSREKIGRNYDISLEKKIRE